MAYNEFYPDLWNHPKFQSLDRIDQMTYIYSWTNESCTASGIYIFPENIAKLQLKLSREELLESLKKVQETSFIMYDFETSVIWVRAKYKFATNPSPNHKLRIQNEFLRTPKYPFWREFWEKYEDLRKWLERYKYNKRQDELKRLLEGLQKPLAKPYQKPLRSLADVACLPANQPEREEAPQEASSLSSPPSISPPPENSAGEAADSELAQGALRPPSASEQDERVHEIAKRWSTPEELPDEEPQDKSPKLPDPLPKNPTLEQIENQKLQFTTCYNLMMIDLPSYSSEMRTLDRMLEERKRRDQLDELLEETPNNASGSSAPPD